MPRETTTSILARLDALEALTDEVYTPSFDVPPPTADELVRLSRSELDALGRSLGLDAVTYPNKGTLADAILATL